jgi:hypothetical protein
MTVRELIDVLQMMPQDMMVVIPGYEGGFDNPKLSSDSLILDDNWDGEKKSHWYNGRHAPYYDGHSEGQPIACVVVGRE